MNSFDPIEEAQNAATFSTDDGPVISWGAADYYRNLQPAQAAQWKEKYLTTLREKFGIENPVFQTATGPID